MLFNAAVCLSLAALSWAQDSNVQTVEAALKKAGVIPDVLPSNFTPAFPIEVVFEDSSSNSTIPVTAGMNLTMNETANIPFFAIQSNNTQIIGKPYLMAIVDPDAPSPPNRTEAQFLHFLGADYVSQNLTDNEFFILSSNSTPLMPFVGPTPPNGSIPHRYVVAMYLQTGGANVTAANGTVPANRTNFNLTTFAAETGNLTLLGATFFFVGPGNSTANNTATGNASLSSILSSPSATSAGGAGGNGTAAGGGGSGGAASLDFVVPSVWSALAIMFGAAAYLV